MLIHLCVCDSFPFGFEDGVWHLIVWIPDYCLPAGTWRRNDVARRHYEIISTLCSHCAFFFLFKNWKKKSNITRKPSNSDNKSYNKPPKTSLVLTIPSLGHQRWLFNKPFPPSYVFSCLVCFSKVHPCPHLNTVFPRLLLFPFTEPSEIVTKHMEFIFTCFM